MISRTEMTLGIARRNSGLIDLAIGVALLPEVRERTVRQLYEDLQQLGALRSGWVKGEWPPRKVWLDRKAQRHYFADVALVPGKTPSLAMGDKFFHKMMAAELVVGLTSRGRLGDAKLDSELQRIAGRSAPDGHVILQDGSLLLLELERMLGQSWEHWANEGEIGDSIAEHMRSKAVSKYLVCAPREDLLHLAEAVIKADKRRNFGDPPAIPPGYGCWVVSTENHRADVTWCSFGSDGGERAPIPGISSIRRDARAQLMVSRTVPPRSVAQATPPVRFPGQPTPAEAMAALEELERQEEARRRST